MISPDRIEDVPSIKPDPYPDFDNFAWRAFIALNWPSLTDPTNRGSPDRAKTLGDPGPRVWETFKARYELFQVGPDGRPGAPRPWATYEAANPCGANVDNRTKNIRHLRPVHGFQSIGLLARRRRQSAGGAEPHLYPLRGAHQRTGVLGACGSWLESGPEPSRSGPPGGIACGLDRGEGRVAPLDCRGYASGQGALLRGREGQCRRRPQDARGHARRLFEERCRTGRSAHRDPNERPAAGTVGHFEHVDNVPPAGGDEAREPDARDAGAPYSFFNASKPKLGLWPTFGLPDTLPVSINHPPKIDPEPMQVVRRHPIHPSTMAMNRAYWALPGIKGTVWEHYMLVASQWPTIPGSPSPQNDGGYFPGQPLTADAPRENYQSADAPKENLVNTTIETYFQDPPSSCMSCHQSLSNALGRDFVGMLGSFR